MSNTAFVSTKLSDFDGTKTRTVEGVEQTKGGKFPLSVFKKKAENKDLPSVAAFIANQDNFVIPVSSIQELMVDVAIKSSNLGEDESLASVLAEALTDEEVTTIFLSEDVRVTTDTLEFSGTKYVLGPGSLIFDSSVSTPTIAVASNGEAAFFFSKVVIEASGATFAAESKEVAKPSCFRTIEFTDGGSISVSEKGAIRYEKIVGDVSIDADDEDYIQQYFWDNTVDLSTISKYIIGNIFSSIFDIIGTGDEAGKLTIKKATDEQYGVIKLGDHLVFNSETGKVDVDFSPDRFNKFAIKNEGDTTATDISADKDTASTLNLNSKNYILFEIDATTKTLTILHKDSGVGDDWEEGVTSKTYGALPKNEEGEEVAIDYGSKFKFPIITVDKQGHITVAGEAEVTMPEKFAINFGETIKGEGTEDDPYDVDWEKMPKDVFDGESIKGEGTEENPYLVDWSLIPLEQDGAIEYDAEKKYFKLNWSKFPCDQESIIGDGTDEYPYQVNWEAAPEIPEVYFKADIVDEDIAEGMTVAQYLNGIKLVNILCKSSSITKSNTDASATGNYITIENPYKGRTKRDIDNYPTKVHVDIAISLVSLDQTSDVVDFKLKCYDEENYNTFIKADSWNMNKTSFSISSSFTLFIPSDWFEEHDEFKLYFELDSDIDYNDTESLPAPRIAQAIAYCTLVGEDCGHDAANGGGEGGLQKVNHDSSMSGDGTSANPLKVVSNPKAMVSSIPIGMSKDTLGFEAAAIGKGSCIYGVLTQITSTVPLKVGISKIGAICALNNTTTAVENFMFAILKFDPVSTSASLIAYTENLGADAGVPGLISGKIASAMEEELDPSEIYYFLIISDSQQINIGIANTGTGINPTNLLSSFKITNASVNEQAINPSNIETYASVNLTSIKAVQPIQKLDPTPFIYVVGG